MKFCVALFAIFRAASNCAEAPCVSEISEIFTKAKWVDADPSNLKTDAPSVYNVEGELLTYKTKEITFKPFSMVLGDPWVFKPKFKILPPTEKADSKDGSADPKSRGNDSKPSTHKLVRS